MSEPLKSATDRAKTMLADAETFHLPSAPLPLALLRELILLAERALPATKDEAQQSGTD